MPIQRALKRNNGKYVTNWGGKLMVVLNFLNGEPFSGRREEFSSAGGALAKFHKIGKQYVSNNPSEIQNIKKLIPVEKPYKESRELYLNGFRERLLSEHECKHSEVCKVVKDSISLIDETIKSIDGDFSKVDKLSE